MEIIKLPGELESIPKAVTQVSEFLKNKKVSSKNVNSTVLLLEEIIGTLLEEQKPEEFIIKIKRGIYTYKVIVEAQGEAISPKLIKGIEVEKLEDSNPVGIAAIRSLILKAYSERISVKNKNHYNIFKIYAGEPSKEQLALTLLTMIVGILAGVVIKLALPVDAQNAISNYVLDPVKTIFMSFLNLIIAPLIFFSIGASIGTFTDLSQVGKIGGKIMCFYLFTTCMAVACGFAAFCIWGNVDVGCFGFVADGTQKVAETSGSMDVISAFIPSNFLKPFVESNTMQIIVIALLVGIATAKLGAKSAAVSGMLSAGNELFTKIATMITKFLPVMILASMCSLVVTLDTSSISSILQMAAGCLTGIVMIITIYLIVVAIMTKSSPFTYLKRCLPALLNVFALSSSSGSIPTTLEVVEKNLGVSPKVASFSIPLGATINMDGGSIIFVLATMFFAKASGIEMGVPQIIMLIVLAICLSMSAPGIPGAGIALETILLSAFGIPEAALAIFIPLSTIMDPISTTNTVLGDMTGTYVVAKRMGMVDLEKAK